MALEKIRSIHPNIANVLRELQGFSVKVVAATAVDVNMVVPGINSEEDTLDYVIDDLAAGAVEKSLADMVIGDGKAIGSVIMNVPNVADTVTVNSLVYTAVAGVVADNTEYDQTSNITAADSLASSVNSRDGANVTALSDGATLVDVTAVAKGTGGNAFTLAESTAGVRQSVSGATLSEGTGVKANQTIQCVSIVAGQSVTIRGLTYTAVLEANKQTAKFDEFSTGATPTDGECAINLAAAINGREKLVGIGSNLTANAVTDTVTVTATSFGTDPNAYTVVESPGAGFTLGGATFTGGLETSGVIRSTTGAMTGRVLVFWHNKK